MRIRIAAGFVLSLLAGAAAIAGPPVAGDPDHAQSKIHLHDGSADDGALAALDDVPGDWLCAAGKLGGQRAEIGDAPPPDVGGIAVDPGSTDVLHYFLDLSITPASTFLSGTCTMTVKSLVSNLNSFQFRLADVFIISSITVNGQIADWTRLDPINVQVTFAAPFANDAVFDLAVSYSGVPSDMGMGSILFQNRGIPAVKVFYTLSEPWFAYTWWPQKDDIVDKATGTMQFTVPNNYSVASNGLLTAEVDRPGNLKRFTWETNYQTAPYLFSMAGANYFRFSDTHTYAGGTMPMQFFIYPDSNTSTNRNRWLATNQMLTTFGTKFGLYPFLGEKYGIYQFGFQGGMEHQTMTGQGVFSESVTAHELAHQWWGDNVTCETWSDIWLNESFATYSEALWYEFKPGGGHAALLTAMSARRPSSVDGTVYIPSPTSVNRIFSNDFSYRKGAWALHMLRHAVGDSNFFNSLATYRAAFQGGTATTAEFQAVCEAVCGQSLGWFFDEWIRQPGAPNYEYAWRVVTVLNKPYLELYLRQVQSAVWPTFTMPVDVKIFTSETTSYTTPVWNTARDQHYLIPQTAAPLGLALDPEDMVLNLGKASVPFVEGPPKIVGIAPAPGARVESVETIIVNFHKDVMSQAADYALHGEQSGDHALDLEYDPGTMTAALRCDALPQDRYTFRVSGDILDSSAHLRLDGEVVNPAAATSLPTGDGLAGGEAVFSFTVTGPVTPADMNCDGLVNNFDIDPFVLALVSVSAYEAAYPLCSITAGDVNQSGHFDNFDIDPFVSAVVGR